MKETPKRSTTVAAKAARKAALVAAVRHLFETHSFATINVTDIVRQCGLAKGTFYLYYESKEQIFLELLQEDFTQWTRAVVGALGKHEPMAHVDADFLPLADTLLTVLRAFPTLPRLLPQLHLVLEQNVPIEAVLAFKRLIQVSLQKIANAWQCRIEASQSQTAATPSIDSSGDRLATTTFLLQCQALLVGCHQMAHPPEHIAALLEGPELRDLKIDFWEFLSLSTRQLAQAPRMMRKP